MNTDPQYKIDMLSRVIAIPRLLEIAWYAYLLLLAMFLFGSALSILSESPTAFDVLDVPMAATALVGVLGFVSRRRIFGAVFWRVFIPALLAWDIAYNLVLAGQLDFAMRSVEPMEGFPWDLIAGLTFLAPMYVALFLYGYWSNAIWAGLTEPRRFTLPFLKTNAERWFAVVGAAPIPPIIIVIEAFDLWGFPTLLFAPIVGLALLPLDMLLLALIARLRPQDFIQLRCQVCNLAVRPLVRWPRTRQQFLWGGWTCRGCGSELDRHGNLRT